MQKTEEQIEVQRVLKGLNEGVTFTVAKEGEKPPETKEPEVETPPAPKVETPPEPEVQTNEEIKALKAQLEDVNKRFGGLRSARDQRVDELQKQLDELKAEKAERERLAQIAAVEAKRPEGVDAEFEKGVEFVMEKKAVVAPPAPPPKAPAADEPDPETVKWGETVEEAVPDFPAWLKDDDFKSFLGSKIGTENLGKWKNNPAWAALLIKDARGEYEKAKLTSAQAEAERKRTAAGTELPEGGKHGIQPGTKKMSLEDAIVAIKSDPKFNGMSWAEMAAELKTRGFEMY